MTSATMPDHDVKIISAVLGHNRFLKEDADAIAPRKGGLKTTPETFATGSEALARFLKLDGPGWLQEAGTPEILHGDATAFGGQLADLAARLDPAKVWPVAGERASADGKTSLHLRRASDGWLVTMSEELSDTANGILITKKFLSTDLKQQLLYHLACTLQEIGSHQEWRPSSARFVNFIPAPSSKD